MLAMLIFNFTAMKYIAYQTDISKNLHIIKSKTYLECLHKQHTKTTETNSSERSTSVMRTLNDSIFQTNRTEGNYLLLERTFKYLQYKENRFFYARS
jgi:hypothetical protein